MKIPESWTFKSQEIAKNFDSHVREQLPWYDLATRMVEHCARHYVADGGLVYDIGCSTGNISRALGGVVVDRGATLVGIDDSHEMIKRYSGPTGSRAICMDAVSFDYQPFDFAILFLTLMFVPVDRRSLLLDELRLNVKDGGAILVVDKCEPVGGYVGTVMTRLAMREKLDAGVKPEEIIKKELSLSGVQRPLAAWEHDGIGVEVFRFGDFAGWLIDNA